MRTLLSLLFIVGTTVMHLEAQTVQGDPPDYSRMELHPDESALVRLVPVTNGFAVVTGPIMITARAGVEWAAGPTVASDGTPLKLDDTGIPITEGVKGPLTQVFVPTSTNAMIVEPITVQILDVEKKPRGDKMKIECTNQKFNMKTLCHEFVFENDSISVVMAVFMPAPGRQGFTFKKTQCFLKTTINK